MVPEEVSGPVQVGCHEEEVAEGDLQPGMVVEDVVHLDVEFLQSWVVSPPVAPAPHLRPVWCQVLVPEVLHVAHVAEDGVAEFLAALP